MKRNLFSLINYNAPNWLHKVKHKPGKFIKLVSTPTPIENWSLKEVQGNFNLNIKRDDLTGNLLSGNKVRKLEFLLADAVDRGCSSVITCGGLHSNHCRATAVAARKLGLKCHLLHRSRNPEVDIKECRGNMLLNRLSGAQLYTVPYESLAGGLQTRLELLRDHLSDQGEVAYIIPLGGSDNLGTFGIFNLYQELLDQNISDHVEDIVVATGSGGTLAGLAVANHLNQTNIRIHGVCVCDNADYFYAHVQHLIEGFGLEVVSHVICNVIDGYKGRGYGMTTPEDSELLVSVAQQTGVILDSTYTLKALKGMLGEMRNNPETFQGRRVLFIHTGGLFSAFEGTINEALLKSNPIKNWQEKNWK